VAIAAERLRRPAEGNARRVSPEARAHLSGIPPPGIFSKLQQSVRAEKSVGCLTLSDESPTRLGWQIKNLLHLIGWPLLVLIALPLLLLVAPFYIIALRQLEKTDPVVCPAADQKHSENLSHGEDHDGTNQFSAMGTLKPSLVRLLTTIAVLKTLNYGARHITRPGRLGRIRLIHFARWVFVGGTERMIFCSNYDVSVESYMDDFINKTGFGLIRSGCILARKMPQPKQIAVSKNWASIVHQWWKSKIHTDTFHLHWMESGSARPTFTTAPFRRYRIC
jgi:hypothetical protein